MFTSNFHLICISCLLLYRWKKRSPVACRAILILARAQRHVRPAREFILYLHYSFDIRHARVRVYVAPTSANVVGAVCWTRLQIGFGRPPRLDVLQGPQQPKQLFNSAVSAALVRDQATAFRNTIKLHQPRSVVHSSARQGHIPTGRKQPFRSEIELSLFFNTMTKSILPSDELTDFQTGNDVLPM